MTKIIVSTDKLFALKSNLENQKLNNDEWPILIGMVERYISIEVRRLNKIRDKAAAQSNDIPAAPLSPESSDDGDDTDASGQAKDTNEEAHSTTNDGTADIFSPESAKEEPSTQREPEKEREKPKGHGRNPHSAFTNASNIFYALPESILGTQCKKCGGGMAKYTPQIQIVIKGQPSFVAERHIAERFTCKCCNHSVVASTPEIKGGIGKSVIYDPSAIAMLIVLHYGAFIPFNRIDFLHKSWGVPFASSNQWDVIAEAYERLKPLYDAIILYAVFNVVGIRFDDTGSIVWALKSLIKEQLSQPGVDPKSVRSGINASALLMDTPEGLITLFFTGIHHAAEIFEKMLEKRNPEAEPLTKVTDHANKNYVADNDSTISGSCHTHIYLKFFPAKEAWPNEYAIVAEAYYNIYQNDKYAKDQNLSPQERLVYHQNNSTQWLNNIHKVCQDLLQSRKIDRSDIIWPAVSIVINQWELMNKFLEVPGIPLDTNDVERTLIQIVKYLAASFGYKTQNGADKGDMAMSLIATARNFDLEPVEYLRHCLENYKDLAENPDKYLPWNYLKNRSKPPNTIEGKAA